MPYVTQPSKQGREEALLEALQNAMGFLDTPIARRKLGIPADAGWLQAARELSKGDSL